MIIRPVRRGILFLMGILLAAAVWAQQAGESVIIRKPVDHDLYAAGRVVVVAAPVAGDIAAAGQSVTVEQAVEGDAMVAGETVLIQGSVQDDVRAAGRRVQVAANIGDHIVAAGENVDIEPAVQIGGFAWLAGATVRLKGRVGRALKAVGQRVIINGSVGGDADISADLIEIRPGAEIQGDLIWRSENPPEISGEARIGGRLIERPPPAPVRPEVPLAAFGIFYIVSLMTAGIVLYLLVPRFSDRALAVMRGNPVQSLGRGFLGLAAPPFAIGILFITTVGFLLALILLALYLAALPVAWLLGSLFVGDWALEKFSRREHASRGRRLLALVSAIVLLCLLQLIPVLGLLIGLAVTMLGLGALLTAFYRGEHAQALESA